MIEKRCVICMIREEMGGNFRQGKNIPDRDTEVGNRKEINKERKRQDWPKERVEGGEP